MVDFYAHPYHIKEKIELYYRRPLFVLTEIFQFSGYLPILVNFVKRNTYKGLEFVCDGKCALRQVRLSSSNVKSIVPLLFHTYLNERDLVRVPVAPRIFSRCL